MRGQVTTFIILGIVLLVVVAAGFYIYFHAIKAKAPIVVPEKVKPVQSYLDDCLRNVARDGINLIGVQGGYKEVRQENIPINPFLPFTNYLDIFNDGNLRVAYWFYETDNGIQKEQIPSLIEIKNNIEDYIEENIDSCLDNFTQFEGYEILPSKFKVNVNIKDDKLLVKENSDVVVNFDEESYTIGRNTVELNVRLGSLYKIAKKIIEESDKGNYLEEKTIDIMAMYDEIPYSGIDFDCDVKLWNKVDIYNKFKKIVRDNIGQVKVGGTKYTGEEGYFIWEILDKTYDNVAVDFTYSETWPFKMEVAPSEGNILKGMSITQNSEDVFLRTICMNNYQFIYNVKYPVLISLNDLNAFNGQGYNFQIATQVIIENNQVRKSSIDLYDRGDILERFCDNKIANADVYIYNEKGERLGGVDIYYKCATRECYIGKSSGSLNADFPPCLNGFLVARKDGYLESKVLFSSNQESKADIKLKEKYILDLDVDISGELENDEIVIVNLENKDDDYKVSIAYPESENVELVSGDYNAKIYLMTKGEFTVKGGNVKQCIKVPSESILGVLGFTKEECLDINLEDMKFSELMIGGNEIEFYLPLSDLENNNKIKFFVERGALPTNYNELEKSYRLVQGRAPELE